VETLISDETSLDSLFPPGKFFQAKYAAQALRTKLEDQLRSVSVLGWPFGLLCTDNGQSTFDDEFLANSIQLLDKALLNPDLIKSRAFTSQGVQLAVVLIDVLLQFLRGKSPRTTWSSSPISNVHQSVLRLVSLQDISQMRAFLPIALWR
jgi:ubiquitin carboxyl-terminal hydrolase 34